MARRSKPKRSRPSLKRATRKRRRSVRRREPWAVRLARGLGAGLEWSLRTMLALLVRMAAHVLSGLGLIALMVWAFVSGLWSGMRREWEERDRRLRDSRPSISGNAPSAQTDHPAATGLQPGEVPAKVTPEANKKNVVVLARRPNR